jgi:hypothetical protein
MQLTGVVRSGIPFALIVKLGDPVIPDAANAGVERAVILDERDCGAAISFRWRGSKGTAIAIEFVCRR